MPAAAANTVDPRESNDPRWYDCWRRPDGTSRCVGSRLRLARLLLLSDKYGSTPASVAPFTLSPPLLTEPAMKGASNGCSSATGGCNGTALERSGSGSAGTKSAQTWVTSRLREPPRTGANVAWAGNGVRSLRCSDVTALAGCSSLRYAWRGRYAAQE